MTDSNSTELLDALVLLQEKVAFLEQSMQELSDEYFTQQKELIELKEMYLVLKEKIDNQEYAEQSSSNESLVVDERPPHY